MIFVNIKIEVRRHHFFLRKNKVYNFSKQLIKRFIFITRIIVFCIKYFRLIIYIQIIVIERKGFTNWIILALEFPKSDKRI